MTDYPVLENTFIDIPSIEEVVLFGSRAKGNFKPGSDIDIAIKGEDITADTPTQLSSILNHETPLPYFFDVLHIDTIQEPRLIEHIKRVGLTLYVKPKLTKLA